MSNENQATYSSPNIVGHYTELKRLQPAEEAILERIHQKLSSMKMLDLGVGGGRTTKHFAPLVKEYVGIDYSAQMIEACEQRFPKISSITSLAVGDARNLSQFPDDTFDFMLFSFNGIDSVTHEDRQQILREVQRVGKKDSYFLFSSHNLQGAAREFDYKKHIGCNPLQTYVNLVMFGLLRLCNRSVTRHQLNTSPHLMIRDESHNFRLKHYYIRPEAQKKQLAPYFHDIEVYPWNSKDQISGSTELSTNADMWLYYFCIVN
ncbi:MAG: class I SAM-dependent methyltransferase [Cyanobacteria bacterium P01_E01_bin.6]